MKVSLYIEDLFKEHRNFYTNSILNIMTRLHIIRCLNQSSKYRHLPNIFQLRLNGDHFPRLNSNFKVQCCNIIASSFMLTTVQNSCVYFTALNAVSHSVSCRQHAPCSSCGRQMAAIKHHRLPLTGQRLWWSRQIGSTCRKSSAFCCEALAAETQK